MIKKLNDFIEKNPKNFIIIIFLYGLCAIFFPYDLIGNLFRFSNLHNQFLFIIFKLIFSIFPIIVYFGYCKNQVRSFNYVNFILLFLLIAICVNNFPFLSFLQGKITFYLNGLTIFIHIFKCISISVFEEFIFRGVIFIILTKILTKNKLTLSILITNALFGLFHLTNIFAGVDFFYVLFQVGYSFLIGCLFNLSFIISKNIFAPIILHFIYNFGGLLQENDIILGQIWTFEQVLITVIIGLIGGLYALWEIIKIYKKEKNNEGSCSKS